MNVKKTINFLKAFLLPAGFFLVFSFASGGRLANWGAFMAIVQQTVYPTIVAFAIYNIFETGLWDLASGSIIIAASVIGGNLASRNGWGVIGMVAIIVVLCVLMTVAVCTIQLVTQIPSMIVSCGMVMIYEAVAAVAFSGSFSAPREWTFFSRPPYCYCILVFCFVVMYLLVNRTKFGYHVRALGRGSKIAVDIGVSISKTLYKTYILQGVMLSCAALLYISMNGSASAAMNLGTTSIGFNAIVSVLVGQYLAVYCGPLFGVFIGALTLRILGSGLLALGLAATWQKVANGIFLILFLGFSQNQRIIALARQRKKKIQELEKRIAR